MDKVSKQQRSANMAMIKSSGTSIELAFEKALKRQRLSFSKHPDWLGKPDFAFRRAGLVVFLDSCFWHKCPYHYVEPKSKLEYWIPKIARNVLRDKAVRQVYRRNGWCVLRFWQHQIKNNLECCIAKTQCLILSRQKQRRIAPKVPLRSSQN
jgi:DNA mismatch endonuclease, patch repair protein